MARLHILGDWHGPGEEKTARRLADELPQSWDVIAGRQIPDSMSTVDLDLVVVGDHAIFVCEEKAWGRDVRVGEVAWFVDGDRRHNPANQVAHASRVLAGRLKSKVSGWATALGALPRGARPVSGHVVLSHDALVLRGAEELGTGVVLRLADAAEQLVERDAAFPDTLAALRPKLMSYLLGLGQRAEGQLPRKIMQYRVLGRPMTQGNARVFPTQNPAGENVGLYCVPLTGAEDPDAARLLATREHDALQALAVKERTWRVQGWFEWEGYLVTPIVVAMDGTSLGKLAHDANGSVDVEVGGAVVHDAFRALADVHAQNITHRALQLRSIEVTPPPQSRVRFRDFSRAHLPSSHTIAPVLGEDHPSSTFQAPGVTPEFFQPGDDIYALALCLVQWLHSDAGDEPDHDLARSRAAAHPVFGDVLTRCLDPDITVRPTATSAAALTSPAPPQPEPQPNNELDPPVSVDDERMEPNGLLAGRYRLLHRLGEGAWAITWLAWDERLEVQRTLKHLHPHRSQFEHVRAEYMNADALASRYCARVYDVLSRPEPGVLVQEYVPGQSLHDAAQNGRLTDEEHVRRIAVDVLRGLADAHEQLLYHRDVSPNNIIVREDGSAALIDFGLSMRVTDAKSAVGSPPYTAPEVITRRHWSPAADIYSAAVSVLHAVLGRYPYAGLSLDERRMLLAPSEAQRRRYGSALLDTLFRAAAFDENERPQSARAFADELARARDTPQPDPTRTQLINPTVDALRGLYRRSEIGNAGNRGMDDVFAHDTYVGTRLDEQLLPAVLGGQLDVVVLSGNPGDGKTSFLVQVGQALDGHGAATLDTDAAGWRKRLGGHTFAAVYDASESHGELSADDLLRSALDPGDGDDPARRTVLLAANDGRVAQFFGEHAERYPDIVAALDRQRIDGPASGARVVLVDLKRRALAFPADVGQKGLGLGILDSLTAPARWEVCSGCITHDVCPIRRNAESLRTDGARAAVSELLLTSHLRRRRRATVRDVRSAFGWVITGDLSCATVHAEYDRGQDPSSGPARLTPDLAFTSGTGDYLVDEWSDIDPAGLAAPGVGRAARADRRLLPDLSAVETDVMGALKRSLFFGAWNAPQSARREVRGYRYLDEYLAALSAPQPPLARVLLGISRILAYPGYDGEHLALRDRAYDDPSVRAIVVVKELRADEFQLEPATSPSPYVESFTDQLVLVHPASNARLRVTVDLAELLLRAADGEIVADTASAALRQEIHGFGNRLRLQPARSVRVVDGSGRAVRARVIDGGRIALEDAT
ncbi:MULTISPECIES: protein kinase [unclassified Pseudonocardia]|uniref:protein kinase domain-containing protein n=1 Tax=unclassified Pseudonocardia TaxID=2619320 RepID=UPI00094AAE55|nr:protein kinase [Pseudonocardia sp. Ae707_Ps1]OLM08994.1 serine/threonine protein kinase [Pseudonocardia sp. Ae707_Ps1]